MHQLAPLQFTYKLRQLNVNKFLPSLWVQDKYGVVSSQHGDYSFGHYTFDQLDTLIKGLWQLYKLHTPLKIRKYCCCVHVTLRTGMKTNVVFSQLRVHQYTTHDRFLPRIALVYRVDFFKRNKYT